MIIYILGEYRDQLLFIYFEKQGWIGEKGFFFIIFYQRVFGYSRGHYSLIYQKKKLNLKDQNEKKNWNWNIKNRVK